MNDRGFYIPVLSALTLAAFVLLLRFFPDVTSWKLCEPARCTVQDWLAATAGWIGFVAAAIGAGLVFGQLFEQKKQTAFLLGDGSPTLEIVRGSGKTTSGEFKIVNWNRRTLVIRRIEIECEHEFGTIHKFMRLTFDADGNKERSPIELTKNGSLRPSQKLDGWLDRQSAPPSLKFGISLEGFDSKKFKKRGDILLTISLYTFTTNDQSKPIILTVSSSMLQVFPSHTSKFA